MVPAWVNLISQLGKAGLQVMETVEDDKEVKAFIRKFRVAADVLTSFKIDPDTGNIFDSYGYKL